MKIVGARWILRSGTGNAHAVFAANLVSRSMATAFAQLISDRTKIPLVLERVLANPTLVHHGAASAAAWHLLTEYGKPVADLYGMKQSDAARVARLIANRLQVPLQLLDNAALPAALKAHRRSYVDAGVGVSRNPKRKGRNPAGSLRDLRRASELYHLGR